MKKNQKNHSRKCKNLYVQRKNQKNTRYPFKVYKITLVSYDNSKVQRELDDISYKAYLQQIKQDNSNE